MNKLKIVNLLLLAALACLYGCKSTPSGTLKPVGSRGWHTTVGPYAAFDPKHKHVEIWTPNHQKNAPLIIYAHGGAGYREDDRARVNLMRRNGFATISFDAYEMNGLDWQFVTRRVTNEGKQNLIWAVFEGAFEYARTNDDWDNKNIFLYGASNGGRTVLYAGSKLNNESVKGIISEAPAATGYELEDYNIPTIILFGKLDTWAGKSDTDFVWKRTYPNSPISIEQWVNSLKEKGRPIDFIFYEQAGHLLFEGPLEKVTVKRGDKIAFTAYQGADENVLKQYEKDIIEFVNTYLVE
jgi:dienelactone hydrolase